jgi:hypothetical protein
MKHENIYYQRHSQVGINQAEAYYHERKSSLIRFQCTLPLANYLTQFAASTMGSFVKEVQVADSEQRLTALRYPVIWRLIPKLRLEKVVPDV